MYNLSVVTGMFENYRLGVLDEMISPSETMNNQWYFEVGRSALDVVAAALMASRVTSVQRVLDLPCGHGRVLRHLALAFPQASLAACDLDEAGVEFCASRFKATPIHSRQELSEVDLGSEYDLIWCGSLFTHTSEEVTTKWMAHLARFLSPRGIVVATLHGRFSERVHEVSPYIAEERWHEIKRQYASRGYGYEDYPRGASHDYLSGHYGVSMAKPHVTIRSVEQIPGVRIYMYLERGWADHQDVVVFGRPGHDEPWPGMRKA